MTDAPDLNFIAGRRAVPEWIGKHPDQDVPRHVRARIFDRAGGRCHISKRKIQPGEPWELDHIVALRDGGEHRESNLAPALTIKHREKTAAEAGQRAKVDRIRAKHTGTWGKSKTPIRSRGFEPTRRFKGDPA